jgi:hypothetical protein
MMKSVSPWTLTIILSAVVAVLALLVPGDGQLRLVFVLWFLLACPGMMLVRFFHLGEPLLEWVVAITLSVATDSLVAGSLLYSGRWSTSSAFAIVIAITTGGVLLQELNAIRTQRRKPA